MAVVLKEFLWAPDGYTVEKVKPGRECDFGAATNGLHAEGYVSDKPVDAHGPDLAPVSVVLVPEPELVLTTPAPVEPFVEPVVIAEPAIEVVEPVAIEVADAEPVAVEPVVSPPADPFDHDGDGKPGGSLPKSKRGKRR